MGEFLLFVACLLAFHVVEFLVINSLHPNAPVRESLLLDSNAYLIAMAFACAEYAFWTWQGLSRPLFVRVSGLGLVLAGEAVRKRAILVAGRNFTHRIAVAKRPEHSLVTNDVYAYIRHPAYFGWFLWAPGTQVLLCNPVSTLGFTYLAWRFFKVRIPVEERYLLRFFGEEFARYRDRTPTCIPGIP
ncbi:unnamed protein product [Pedinophyceae sp. YPF-701]|nr:unnamed protein product [Pedinophyceae sp. YPF-701]